MIFYHGTTAKNWEKIKKEGVLWGVRKVEGLNPSRCTYLAIDKENARYNQDKPEVLLKVSYDPNDGMNRQIIRCPVCEEKGEKQNLAELLPTGQISIQRIRKGARGGIKRFANHTVVDGCDIILICGNCGEQVFLRRTK